MSAFDIKPISEQDAFKLEVAKDTEAQSERNSEPGNDEGTSSFNSETSPVAEVVEQIMAHWAESDEGWVQQLAEESGDERLKRVVGEKAAGDNAPKEGIEGDFRADTAGPDDGLDLPPKADGGEFGGGGGGGGGGDADAEGPAWMQGDEGGMADPGDQGDGGELPGFTEMEAEMSFDPGGDGDGDAEDEDEDELPIMPPADPKKPKKP
jgi:hypothetical protein